MAAHHGAGGMVPSSQYTAAPAAMSTAAPFVPGTVADFTKEEKEAIQRCLNLHLGPEYISYRPAPTGGKVAYIEGWRALDLANETFGFSGWSSSVQDMSVDFVRQRLGENLLGPGRATALT